MVYHKTIHFVGENWDYSLFEIMQRLRLYLSPDIHVNMKLKMSEKELCLDNYVHNILLLFISFYTSNFV